MYKRNYKNHVSNEARKLEGVIKSLEIFMTILAYYEQ
jgi:hypothetical protein